MKQFGFLLTLVLLLGISCSKSAGVGGKAVVRGFLQEEVYNILGYQHTIAAQGEDVYITYGVDNQIVDDKVEAGYTGAFEFRYLRPGDYTIYAYSDSWTTPLGADSVVITTFSITSKKQELDLGNLTIVNRK